MKNVPQRLNRRRVTILMERSFSRFRKADRERVLGMLASILDIAVEDIWDIRVTRGCVRIEFTLSVEAAKRLGRIYRNRKVPDPDPELDKLFRWMKDECVVSVDADQDIREGERRKYSHCLVFIHGWSGDDSSFADVPNLLSKRLNCAHVVYPYPTGAWQHSPNLFSVARALENWLRDEVGYSRYAFIAHSMGGLVARKLIASQLLLSRHRLDEHVFHLSLLASPSNGAVLAPLTSLVPALQSAQLHDLRPDSSFLLELQSQWGSWARANVPGNCTVRCLYGTKDKVVTMANAASIDPDAIPVLEEDHIGLPKRPEIVPTLERLIRASRFFEIAPAH